MKKVIPWCILLLLVTGLYAAENLPEYRGPINDYAGVLSPEAIKRLEAKVIAYREQTGNEIGVLIVPTLNHRSIEDYAHDVFNAWGIGKKGNDNGVLFIVAMQERKARIEVGYGLEAELTDIECGRLVSKYSPMAKYFRKGDFASGINAVLDGILQGIGGEYNPPQPKDTGDYTPFGQIIFFLVMLTVISLLRRRRFSHRRFGGPFIGGFGGGFGGGSSGGGGFSFGGGSSGGGGASGGW